MTLEDQGVASAPLHNPSLDKPHGREPAAIRQAGSGKALAPDPSGDRPAGAAECLSDVGKTHDDSAVRTAGGRHWVTRPLHGGGTLHRSNPTYKLASLDPLPPWADASTLHSLKARRLLDGLIFVWHPRLL